MISTVAPSSGRQTRSGRLENGATGGLQILIGILVLLGHPEGVVGNPLDIEAIEIRGRKNHPCVNLTADDVSRAKIRIEKYDWARAHRDRIIKEADKWLRESDEYWLQFLPDPGACYAYGFTGDPITGGSFGGRWSTARCDWDHPGKVKNSEERLLPDEEYPDDGEGYTASDGRIHYFVGIFNSWVTEQWTLNALPSLSKAYLLTGDERYADRGTLLLDALASIYSESTSGSWDYPSNPPSGRFARPWYQVARTLVKYVDQYDFLHSSSAMAKPSLKPGLTRRENIEKNMLLDGAYYCYRHSFDGGLHNGHADYVRGALAVGCALDIPEYVRNAVDSPFSIHAMLANNIDRDGRYYESSLGYAIHARGLYLTYADPLVNLRSKEYPEGVNLYDDPKMQSCLLLPDIQVELAGRRPNFGDSAPDFLYKPNPKRPFSSVDFLYLERMYAMTSDPVKKEQYGSTLGYLADGEIDSKRGAQRGDWLLWHAEEPPVEGVDLPESLESRVNGSWIAGMKGMALLRAGDQAALLRFGPSLTHGDPDDLGLLYYANGYELSYDLGYGLGSTHVHCGWASSTASHCLVTVDETNQLGGEGSGGSLLSFANLPSVQMVEAESANSYTEVGVTEYSRTLALMSEGGYLIDVFRVSGGNQQDYGFGSIGTDLEPFGVPELVGREGSLAEGVAWADKIGTDGDIVGYPNKPYWKPPPVNGYGFFYDVRAGQPETVWGGTWNIDGKIPTRFRMSVLGEVDEAIFASAPGLYPSKPLSSYVLARRRSEEAPLRSTFTAVYEPFVHEGSREVRPVIERTKDLGLGAIEILRTDGNTDVVLTQPCEVESVFGPVKFDGDFGMLTGAGERVERAEVLGCEQLAIDGEVIDSGPGVLTGKIVEVDAVECRVRLDQPIDGDLEGLVAIFSNPGYSRTTVYHIAEASGDSLYLQANSLVLGKGRVHSIDGDTIISDVPHEYARSVPRKHSTLFFDGKRMVGPSGVSTRILSTHQSDTLRIEVESASGFEVGDGFEYIDLSPGDEVRIALPRVYSISE